jgi:hypothetical protein
MVDRRSGSYPTHRSGSRSTDPRSTDSLSTGERLGVAANLAGIAASLASVAGFLLSLRSGDGLWLLCGAGTAVFFLYAAWRRRRMAVAASAVILALVGAGGLLAHFHILIKPAVVSPSPSAHALAVTPSVAPSGSPGTPSAAQSGIVSGPQPGTSTPPPRVLEVTLPRHAAVDVDSAGQPEVVDNQIGATGPYDLYHDAGEVMSDMIRAHDGVYIYPSATSPDSAYAICSDYTGPDPSANTYNPSVGIETGVAFCFRTSAGKLAWASIEAVQPDTYTTVLQVYVWG